MENTHPHGECTVIQAADRFMRKALEHQSACVKRALTFKYLMEDDPSLTLEDCIRLLNGGDYGVPEHQLQFAFGVSA